MEAVKRTECSVLFFCFHGARYRKKARLLGMICVIYVKFHIQSSVFVNFSSFCQELCYTSIRI